MNDIKFSVVIPTYNAQNYIEECIKACTWQTYGNFEVIVVDDGSTDETVAVCERLAYMDNRIRVISKENEGVSSSRNRGINEATGDYILFFDADDIPENTLLEEYLNAMQEWTQKDVSFLMTGMFFDNYANHSVTTKTKTLEPIHGYIEGERYLLSRASASMLAWLKIFNFVTNKCYSLQAIKELGIYYDADVDIAEDLKFNLDYLDAVDGNIGFINKPLYHYIRRTRCGLSLAYHESGLEDTKSIYARFINWEMQQEGVTEDNVLIIKAIFVTDWTNRLTALYSSRNSSCVESKKAVKATLKKEIGSREFQHMLKETYKAKKISGLRYYCLRTGVFEIFYFVRSIYQMFK